MNFQKIINKVQNLFPKKRKSNRIKNRFALNKIEQPSLMKRRRAINFNSKHLEKFKILGDNVKTYYLALLGLFIGLVIYIIVGPLFKISNIEIIKQDNITNMKIAYDAVNSYRGKSILSLDGKAILKQLNNYQNNIRSIKTDIILPNTLKIVIDSYKGVFNTSINGKNFIITENGTLIPSNPSKELKNIIISYKFSKNKFLDFKKIFDIEYINKISNAINSLEENIINLKIKELTYFLIERELHIETENNNTLIFDLNGSYKEQVEKLVVFNKEYLDINKEPIVYLDLRIKNKVFYCTTENEYQCIANIKSVYSYE